MTGDREPDLDLLPDFDLADPAAEPDRLPDLDLADPAADREAADPDLRKIKMFSSSISYTDFRVRTMKIFEPDGNTMYCYVLNFCNLFLRLLLAKEPFKNSLVFVMLSIFGLGDT